MNKNHSVDSSILKPQLLFSIPSALNIKTNVLNNQFLFAFPNGIDISYYEENPKIYSIVLTNEKGIHSYFYILLFYDKIGDSSETKTNLNRNSIAVTSEMHYCPVSIIISTFYPNLDFFRNLLLNLYKIIKFDYSILLNSNSNFNSNEKNSPKTNNSTNSNVDLEKIKSFQKIELLNYLYFCSEIPRPPNKSIFSLNMRLDKISYKFLSLGEIPTNDYCIDILFNTLEYSVIIKLFIALLFEKHIILIANQNMPLFCICESLRFLLFPFRWLHAYIPNLPYDQISYLDSPMPYLFGINTTKTNAQDLINSFPSHIICDVSTSTLYGNVSNLKLPTNEEMKIKTKLLLLKSKYKNNYDEFDNEGYSYNSSRRSSKISYLDEYEDIDFNLSFAQNVQNIFFRIFKNSLKNIKKDYIINNIFNSQNFLNSFEQEEYKLFFEKIINTLAFENFIISMKYLDDSASRKFGLICKNSIDKKMKDNIKQSKYYNYSFTIPKKINKYFNVKEIQDTYDEYTEISNMLDDTFIKSINSFSNSNKLSKSSFFMSKSNKDNKNKSKYNCLNFYGKEGFISFAINNQNNFNYSSIIKNDILQLYQEIINLNDEYHFFGNSSTLLIDYKQYSNKHNNLKIKNLNSNNISFIKDNNNEKIVDAPIEACGQLYLLIAIYLYNTINTNNKDNKNSTIISNSNKLLNKLNNNESKYNLLKSKTNTFNNLPILIKKNNNNINLENNNNINLENIIKAHKEMSVDNIFIFKLFISAFRKNQNEFPRNLFFITLNQFSLEELKKIGKTNLKYIDKTIQCQIRKIEKIAYKELVINNDSDNDDITEEETGSMHKITNLSLIPRINNIDRKQSLKNLHKILNMNLEEETQEEKENNVQKTKVNVVDTLNSSFHNMINTQQNPINNINNIKKIYIQRKISQKINSWNCLDLTNYQNLSSNSYDSNNIKNISLNVDPMATSEQICTKLYLFLSSVKVENYNEKNWDINFFKNLAHSEEFNELKDLILSLKNISIENLSQIPKNYYCFWLNMYNFLTIFSVIYKCEIISNYYEWYRFLTNSYFTIGDVEISLFEIESCILRNKKIVDNIYGKILYKSKLNLPNIEKYDSLINFGISLPTISSPCLRMYFPMNLLESLKFNALEFFSRSLGVDIQNKTIQLPQYINWIDPSFIDNINNYKECVPKEFINYVNNHKMKLQIVIEKFDWKLSYANFKNNELNV